MKNDTVDAMEDYPERLNTYNKNHCWQYDIRLKKEEEDRAYIREALNIEIEDISVKDFEIRQIISQEDKREAIEFIKRYEWLGTITQYSTHYFGAYYRGILGGVTIFSMPNAFSKLLGEETPNLERLVSRGACASWTPKCLASHFLMQSIKQMVATTQYRLFTAYSDPTAKELGTIYQSTNWYYLGQKSGTTTRYINPYTGKIVSDRFFRQKTAYKKYASELGIEWQKEWTGKSGVNWDLIPDDIEKKLREYSKKKQAESKSIEYPNKHKYAYILGRNKSETKKLRQKFESNVKVYPYPKERGK